MNPPLWFVELKSSVFIIAQHTYGKVSCISLICKIRGTEYMYIHYIYVCMYVEGRYALAC